MASQDLQLVLHAHLNHASVAANPQELTKHLQAFTRDWKKEPSLEQFDAALGLVQEARRSTNNLEMVALWWISYVQEIALSEAIDTFSVDLKDALLKAVEPLAGLVRNPSATMVKRSVQTCASIYPVVFQICCQESAGFSNLWGEYAVRIKQAVLGHLASPNEGILLAICKYMQTVVQIQSHSQRNSMAHDSETLSLNKIPSTHPFLNPTVLQHESDALLRELLSVIQRPMISSTVVTAIINQTSALQRARPQFIPIILGTWTSFLKPSPPSHFTPLQIRFIDKAIRIQLLSISKMQLQPPQLQIVTETLSSYGVKYSGNPLSRSQQQQLLHPDDDSKRSSKRGRSSNNQDGEDLELKRMKQDPDSRSTNTPPMPAPSGPPTLPGPPGPPPPNIPPGFGQNVLSQINITQLPVHHVVDIIFETLAANHIPHLFHSFLSTLPIMGLKEGNLPMPPPGAGPPPPGLLLQRPPQMLPPGMMPPPPPGHHFPPHPPPFGHPPHLGPPGHFPLPGAGAPLMPDIKQEARPEVKKELNIAKLALPRIPDNIQVNIKVMPPKRTPTQLPPRPIVVVSDTVTAAALPSRTNEEDSKATDKDVKMEGGKGADSEQSRRLLKQETFQVKPFEPTNDQPVMSNTLPPTKKLLELAFERILGSEHLVSVPGMTGRKMLEAAASGHRESGGEPAEGEAVVGGADGAVVPFDKDGAEEHATKVVTKADWMSIVSRLLTRAFPRNSEEVAASGAQSMKERMVDYICQDFKQRRELALTWLHEEWYYEETCRRQSGGDVDDREPQYLWCLYKILDGITSGTDYDAKDRGLTRFLLEVPELPDGAVDMIQKYCDDPMRAQQGIVCLRDVVNLRPPSRARALELLLSYTAYPEKQQRSMAIVMAKKWYLEHATVGSQVEEFALAQLDALKDYPVPKRAADGEPALSQAGSSAMEGMEQSNPEILRQGSTDVAVKSEVKDEPMDNNHDRLRSPVTSEGKLSGEVYEQALTAAHDDIARLLELYFSLCAKNHSLLGVLLSQYTAFDPFVQRVVRQTIHPLIKSIKSDSTKLLALIRDFPLGAEMLVLRIIFILTDGVRPSPGLVSAVQAAVIQHDLNARFLVPIISGLNKEEVLASLPRIVSLLKGTERERRTVTDVFMKLLSGSSGVAGAPSAGQGVGSNSGPVGAPSGSAPAQQSGGVSGVQGSGGSSGSFASRDSSAGASAPQNQARGPVLSPSELLIQLHLMEDVVGWKAACEAMDICFHHPEIYKSEIIAVVLQQLLDMPTIPSLFMRTVIQAITLYKNLVGFVNSMILARMIQKNVWSRPVLWKGFVRCAKMMQPTSASVIASLPRQQLKEVLAMEPSLKESVDAYQKARSSGRRVGGGAAKQLNVHNVASLPPPAPGSAPASASERATEGDGKGEESRGGHEMDERIAVGGDA
ncbi:hypothetical protein BGW39_008123 [Mortierella sp. 14UC]|nr:hypothetical protein BGW39_008123 [Mortierella sp. 14UC]